MTKEKILRQMMSIISKMLPDEVTLRNPVAEWVADEFGEVFDDAEAVALLRLMAVGVANDHPQGVIAGLVHLHNDIGSFVTRLNDGEFKEWTPSKMIQKEPDGNTPD